MQQTLAWRAMHSQGRGLNSVMIKQLGDDIDRYTLREAEFCCNAIIGFNFGDGHLHDERPDRGHPEALPLRARRVHRRVGGVRADPQGPPAVRVIDAAVGVVERGSWAVADAVAEQPWLPERPDPARVTWSTWPARARHADAPAPPRRWQS